MLEPSSGLLGKEYAKDTDLESEDAADHKGPFARLLSNN
jgi:hypothetical protein